jgi:hypothetical protein
MSCLPSELESPNRDNQNNKILFFFNENLTNILITHKILIYKIELIVNILI